MVKNLEVFSIDPSINKKAVHKLVFSIKQEINFIVRSLYVSFISSDELLDINKKHLKHNYRTDVISFDYSNETELDGEILISVEDAKINAKEYKVSYSEELKRLVIHGLLHLLGYDDKNAKQKHFMREMEKKLIYKNNFSLLAGR